VVPEPVGSDAGIGRVAYRPDVATYRCVAALGNWTPAQPGAKVVTAEEVSRSHVPASRSSTSGPRRNSARSASPAPCRSRTARRRHDVAFDPKADEFALPDAMDARSR
jgi:hypothetical protein